MLFDFAMLNGPGRGRSLQPGALITTLRRIQLQGSANIVKLYFGLTGDWDGDVCWGRLAFLSVGGFEGRADPHKADEDVCRSELQKADEDVCRSGP